MSMVDFSWTRQSWSWLGSGNFPIIMLTDIFFIHVGKIILKEVCYGRCKNF
jgi:hypothetical protein